MNPLPDRSNYSPLCHTHYLTPGSIFHSFFRPDPLPSRELETNTSKFTAARFTAESSRELSALRKLNNKQRQVSSLPDQYFIVSSGQTLYQAASWRLILQSSLLQRFTAESSRELSALRKLNNKQRQVSMFLLKFLIHFPFVSFLSISILSLLPFSILSLLPLPHPFFLF